MNSISKATAPDVAAEAQRRLEAVNADRETRGQPAFDGSIRAEGRSVIVRSGGFSEEYRSIPTLNLALRSFGIKPL